MTKDPTTPVWPADEQHARETYSRALRATGREGLTWAPRVLTWELRRLPAVQEAAIHAIMVAQR